MTPDAATAGMPGLSAPPDISLMVLAVYMGLGLIWVIVLLTMLAIATLPIFFSVLFILEGILSIFQNTGIFLVKMLLLMFRSLRRNILRTSLTYVALFVFTGVLTLIYSVISFLGKVTEEKQTDVKVIMTEKFQIPSMMPPRYAGDLKNIIETELPPESRPKNMKDDFMVWAFVGGSLNPNVKTIENSLFLFSMDPHNLLTMMDGLGPDDITASEREKFVEAVRLMEQDKKNVIVGKDKLAQMGKQVGDEFILYGMNYPGIGFEMRIVGEFPDSRYNNSAVMRFDYLQAYLDDYKRVNGKPHPVADRSMNLVWVRLPNKQAYEQLAGIINQPGKFNSPAVKMETASAGIGSFLDAFKDIFWACKYILMPSLAAIMALVVSITMTISIRERWTEMAVLKVLGFQPRHVLSMVLGEGVLIGVLGGGICTWTIYGLFIAFFAGGMKFPIAFFSSFSPPWEIVIYGPLLGMTVAIIGTFLPAWSARGVKASEVFSQVA